MICYVCEMSLPEEDGEQVEVRIDGAWVEVHDYCESELHNRTNEDDYERFTYA
jgi:ribosome-binding protein aMBF1 (putative translation factor)